MSDVVTRYPTSQTADENSGLTNPTNAYTDNTVYATAAPSKNQTKSTDYSGFDFDSVLPAGCTIDAVKLRYEYFVATAPIGLTRRVAYITGGSHGTNNDAAAEDTSPTVIEVDVTAQRTWARSDLLDTAGFGVHLAARRTGNTADTFSFDYCAVQVSYTPAPAGGASSWGTVIG